MSIFKEMDDKTLVFNMIKMLHDNNKEFVLTLPITISHEIVVDATYGELLDELFKRGLTNRSFTGIHISADVLFDWHDNIEKIIDERTEERFQERIKNTRMKNVQI